MGAPGVRDAGHNDATDRRGSLLHRETYKAYSVSPFKILGSKRIFAYQSDANESATQFELWIYGVCPEPVHLGRKGVLYGGYRGIGV